MALWRFGRGWREESMQAYLAELRGRSVHFNVPVAEMIVEHGWTVDGSEEGLGTEPPGPPRPDGLFARARAWPTTASPARGAPWGSSCAGSISAAPAAAPGELAHRGDETPQRTGPGRGGRVTN